MQRIDAVDKMIATIAKELFSWLHTISQQNEKYADIFKLQNYAFFEETLVNAQETFTSLKAFIDDAVEGRIENENKYILWMVTYEFPSLANLANRLEGVGRRVREEELALYIRRKDVLNVVRDLDIKKLESSVSTMRKRLEKHCDSSEDSELQLVSKLWNKIKSKIVDIVQKLETAASVSYQLAVEVSPQVVSSTFDKYSR